MKKDIGEAAARNGESAAKAMTCDLIFPLFILIYLLLM